MTGATLHPMYGLTPDQMSEVERTARVIVASQGYDWDECHTYVLNLARHGAYDFLSVVRGWVL